MSISTPRADLERLAQVLEAGNLGLVELSMDSLHVFVPNEPGKEGSFVIIRLYHGMIPWAILNRLAGITR